MSIGMRRAETAALVGGSSCLRPRAVRGAAGKLGNHPREGGE